MSYAQNTAILFDIVIALNKNYLKSGAVFYELITSFYESNVCYYEIL